MMIDVTKVLSDTRKDTIISYERVLRRAQRYAAVQGTIDFPRRNLPPNWQIISLSFWRISSTFADSFTQKTALKTSNPAQVRSALSLVIHRLIEAPKYF